MPKLVIVYGTSMHNTERIAVAFFGLPEKYKAKEAVRSI